MTIVYQSPLGEKGFNLTSQDLDYLARSFINEEVAKQASLFRVDSPTGAALVGQNGNSDYSGIVFPYFLPGEDRPREYRIRRDKPDHELKPDGSLREIKKYVAPPGRGNMLYFVPGTLSEWVQDITLPVVITEGEKKALALFALAYYLITKGAKPRFLPVGVSGVWNWRGKVGKATSAGGERVDIKGVIADLDRINWKGRKVYIIFDTNVATDENVKAARRELAKELGKRGAAVYFVDLPPLDGVNGVDDLLAARGEEYALALIDSARPSTEEKKARTSARSLLLRIAEDAELFISEDECFATVTVNHHQETYALRSKAFRQWLFARIFVEEGQGANAQAVQEAIETLYGRAYALGIQRQTFRRIAEADGKIYVDLCDSQWRVVEIDANGWQVLDTSPVKFLRSGGMMALPMPEPGGSLDRLREFVNVAGDDDFALMKAWLVQTLRYDVPFALLALGGEQGSAKSTTANILRSLIDPNTALLRRPPKEEKDLIASARNGWVIALNNLSTIPVWLSDALCCLSVDGGFASRELYTNGEEFILKARRPIILTSIEDIIGKSDLIDRAVSLTLPPIPENRRENERQLMRRFEQAKPQLFGALCEYACAALKNLPHTRIQNLPRMADFAEWGVAAEGASEETSRFLRAYRAMRQTNTAAILEASPLASVLRRFIDREGKWSGTASDLLEELDHSATDKEKQRKSYPKLANSLSNQLRTLAPNLRQNGINIEFGNRQGKKGAKIINIEQIGKTSSAPSADPLGQDTSGLSGNDLAADARLTMADDEQTMQAEGSSAIQLLRNKGLRAMTDDTDDADDEFPDDSLSEAKKVVSVPLMITHKMRSQLQELGYTDAEIDAMKPDEAWRILKGKQAEEEGGTWGEL